MRGERREEEGWITLRRAVIRCAVLCCGQYRVFLGLGPFPTHDWDLWNRTSGQKRIFGRLEWDLRPKTSVNPRESVEKTMRREK